jgi:hypothetical protein
MARTSRPAHGVGPPRIQGAPTMADGHWSLTCPVQSGGGYAHTDGRPFPSTAQQNSSHHHGHTRAKQKRTPHRHKHSPQHTASRNAHPCHRPNKHQGQPTAGSLSPSSTWGPGGSTRMRNTNGHHMFFSRQSGNTLCNNCGRLPRSRGSSPTTHWQLCNTSQLKPPHPSRQQRHS